ncbi:MAG TPA: pitrilysin family protein [Planctomycetota bacterium]|nr:pitrilysin family protein [Planctomycetota bacterium]
MPKRFSVHQLHNGLTLVLEFMPETVSTAVGFHIRTGARNEDPRIDGVSHFLEHMMFKGTANRGWQEINRDFDQMGARYNAFTSWEETCYYAWVLNEEVPRAMDLLSDMLAPALPEDEFNTEKKVILEEIARYNDMPEHIAFEEAMRMAFAGHRLSSNILGSPKTVGKMTREQMLNYFKQRYVPANITLFACGNVNEQALLEQVEKLWGSRTGPRPEDADSTPGFHAGIKNLERKDVTRHHLIIMWPALPLSDRRSMAAMLLGNVLGDDKNSRIFWTLRHTGLAEEAGASYWGFSDTGLMAAHASCDPSKAAKVASLLRAEAAKLKKGIKEEELQRAKNRARTSLVFHSETPFNRFRQLMHLWSVRRELLTSEEMLQRIDAVTLDDLHDLLKEYPLEGNFVQVGLGPLKSASAEKNGRGAAGRIAARKSAAIRKKRPAAKARR